MPADTSKSMPPSVGEFEIVEKIGEGGMGTVYRGRHRVTGQAVAIKMVPPHLTDHATLRKRFENEFRAASRLNHPNVVRGLDYGMVADRAYMVMEFVDGESLGAKLERDGKMPEQEAVRIITQAARGLEHAHEHGLVHRDVKPDNIMLTRDGQVKLADLGLVKAMDADVNLTRTGRGLGTPHFMAPEQFRNAKSADVRCDIYSLGATLYQMVTGELPFRSLGPLEAFMKKVKNELTPPQKLAPGLSERVADAIQRAMASDPAARPASCQEFIEDLTSGSAKKTQVLDKSVPSEDVWYVVYRDEQGKPNTRKGSTDGIRNALKKGRLGDAAHVRVCRTKDGPFEPVRQQPEFQEVMAAIAASRVATTPMEVPPLPPPTVPEPARKPQPARGRPPHIPLEVAGSRTREWVTLVSVAVGATGVGTAIVLLLRFLWSK